MNENEKPVRPVEHEAVRTTIVGGRPPGCGQGIGNIPRGVEVLVEKAAVDAAFRADLLEKRSKAAEIIGLVLTPAEAAILDGVPRGQLVAIIDRTTVHPSQLPAFLGTAAAVMLVALGATGTTGCIGFIGSAGNRTDRMPTTERPAGTENISTVSPVQPVVDNAPATKPPATDNAPVPPVTRGIQPDRPRPKGGAPTK